MNLRLLFMFVGAIAAAASTLLARVPARRSDRRDDAPGARPSPAARPAVGTACTVLRFGIAKAKSRALVEHLRGAGLNGTLFRGCVGFTAQWGIEGSVVVEIADPIATRVLKAVAAWLARSGEECAYFTVDGRRPALLFASGRVEVL